MSMIKLLSYLFVVAITITCTVNAQDSISVEAHADLIKKIVSTGDVDVFRELKCFPSSCIDEHVVEYVFGKDGKKGEVKKILGLKNLNIKIFGPYTFDDKAKNSSYSIVFYNPSVIKLTSDGYMKAEDQAKLWMVEYVETVVIFRNGMWNFHYTPFYHGAHLPWEEDYG